MAVGHSDDVEPLDAIASAIEQCRTALGELQPQGGVLFSAFGSFDRAILTAVREAFPAATVMGSTSAAEISSVDGYQEDSITLALFASDTVDVTTGLGTGLSDDVDAACQAAASEALAATRRTPSVCIMLTEGFAADPQRTLDAMARALPAGVVIVGGTSAARDFSTVRPSYQFCGDRVTSDGVAVLLFSGPIVASTAVGTGWHTIGATGIVTSSDYGRLDQIDGRPAIQFLARYLDVTGPASYGNPLAVVEAGGDESYFRAIQGTDPASGSVWVAGSIPVG
ncbi:MAG: FIST signal transduction protein, partial [Candidatus Limnocylindrales bacterium]